MDVRVLLAPVDEVSATVRARIAHVAKRKGGVQTLLLRIIVTVEVIVDHDLRQR